MWESNPRDSFCRAAPGHSANRPKNATYISTRPRLRRKVSMQVAYHCEPSRRTAAFMFYFFMAGLSPRGEWRLRTSDLLSKGLGLCLRAIMDTIICAAGPCCRSTFELTPQNRGPKSQQTLRHSQTQHHTQSIRAPLSRDMYIQTTPGKEDTTITKNCYLCDEFLPSGAKIQIRVRTQVRTTVRRTVRVIRK